MENITYLYLPLVETAPTQRATAKQPSCSTQPVTPVEPTKPTPQSVVESDRDRTASDPIESTFPSYPTMYF